MSDPFLLQVRISPEVVKAVDRVRIETDETRAQAVERLLRAALDGCRAPGSVWPYGTGADAPPPRDDLAGGA